MTRALEDWVQAPVRKHLEQLLQAAADHSTNGYQETMVALGADLGAKLKPSLPTRGEIVVVSTVEDADFLCRGILGSLELGERLRLFCYWNERDAALDTAPIVSMYQEPVGDVSAVIVVKSIISGACVVRTNLAQALAKIRAAVPIFVVAPVMHACARERLAREFAPDVVDRFNYVVAAVDDQKDGENVVPGIGGSVYELLGLGDKHTKNRYRPRLLSARSNLSPSWQTQVR